MSHRSAEADASLNPSQKKLKERQVLNDVFTFCRQGGGTRARNAKRLSPCRVIGTEKPDFILELKGNKVIGLEHLRVDHHYSKKAKSKSAKLAASLEKQRKSIASKAGEDCFMDAAAKVVVDAMQIERQDSANSSIEDLLSSLNAGLYGSKSGHVPKLASYRENLLAKYPDASKFDLGFLIEIHSDFRGLYLHQDKSCTRLLPGQCPLFDEAYNLLLRTASEVDWLFLGFYPTLGDDIVDAAIIDCRNGMFKKSCERHGLIKTVLLNQDKSALYGKQPEFEKPTINVANDLIAINIGCPIPKPDASLLWKTAMRGTAAAFNCKQEGIPFATSISIEMMYELLIKYAMVYSNHFDSRKVEHLLSRLSPEERSKRLKEFGSRWGLA